MLARNVEDDAMACRIALLAIGLGLAGCSGSPGIPDSGGPYSSSTKPAGDAAKAGGFYGYN
jgi:hypothetical protein